MLCAAANALPAQRFGIVASAMQTTTTSYLLDAYPGAGLAYSVRKLRAAYTGYCMRVVRSSDETYTDVGFTAGGDLDEAAITSFCGSGNGYVSILYDQSGNGKNMFSSYYGNYSICTAGIVNKQGTRPIIKGVVSGGFQIAGVSSSLFVGSSQAYWINTVRPNFSGGDAMYIASIGNDGVDGYGFAVGYSGGMEYGFYSTSYSPIASISSTFTLSSGTQYISEFVYASSTSISQYINGTQYTTMETEGTVSWSSTHDILIGDYYGNGYYADYQELIFYPSNQASNRAAIYNNVNAYF